MTNERVERRLTAIFAADVVGYSRLMGADEVGTLNALKSVRRELANPIIAAHHGRVVKTTGDGILIEFQSVVDAVACAVAIQRGMAERNADVPPDKRIVFRIGINVGDIIIDEGDIYGDGVNIAARLEAICEPGGVCISRTANDQVRDKLSLAFADLGEHSVKNIARPIRAFGLTAEAIATLPEESPRRSVISAEPTPVEPTPLALPDKPSIAVLPFQNMSGDAEQEYFADGVVEDIITALSRFHNLFVIARNSSFTYKGRAVDVKQVGRELGVRYLLEGSVRKTGNKVRINGQLIDAATGAHLWADRFDGTLEDIFDLQDRITENVVGAIAPKLLQAEIERARRKPTENLDAYDYCLRARSSYQQITKEGTAEALRLAYEAIELDPDFAEAYGLAARCYTSRMSNGWGGGAGDKAEVARLTRRAIELGADDAQTLEVIGFALAHTVGEVEAGAALIDRALALNPNLAEAWRHGGIVRTLLGEPQAAIDYIERAMRLSPLDWGLVYMQNGIAQAHFLAGRYDEASSWAERSLRNRPNFMPAARTAAASHALAGRLEEAQRAVARMLQYDPERRVSNLDDVMPPFRPEGRAKYVEGLRKAGLRE